MRSTAESALDYDVYSDWHVSAPYPFLRRLREEHPVFYSDHLDAWVLTRYADVRTALSDEKSFSSHGILSSVTERTPEVSSMLDARGAFMSRFVANVDPPYHTRLRRAVSQAFTPRAVAKLGDRFRDLMRESIDVVRMQGAADAVTHLVWDAPARLTAEFIGVPPEDADLVRGWVENWFKLFLAPHDHAEQPMLAREFLDYLDYVDALVTERIVQPRDDFTSVTAALVGDAADSLTRFDVIEQISALLLGGNDTVPNGLGSAVYRVASAGLWGDLASDPSLIPNTIEEVLRYDGAATGIFRRAAADVTMHDERIPSGARVFVSQDSANHDEAVFRAPECFDIARANAGSHLAFGYGIHHCIGAALTRLEMRIGLEELTTGLPTLRLAPEQAIRYRPSVTGRGLAALQVEWDSR